MAGEKLEKFITLVEAACKKDENPDKSLSELLNKEEYLEISKDMLNKATLFADDSFFKLYSILKKAEKSRIAKLVLTQWHLEGVSDCVISNVNSAYGFFKDIHPPSQTDSQIEIDTYKDLKEKLVNVLQSRVKSCIDSIESYKYIIDKEHYLSYLEKKEILVFLSSKLREVVNSTSHFLALPTGIIKFLDGKIHTIPVREDLAIYQKIYDLLNRNSCVDIKYCSAPKGYSCSDSEWEAVKSYFNEILLDNVLKGGERTLVADIKEGIHSILNATKLLEGRISQENVEQLTQLIIHSNQASIHWEEDKALAQFIQNIFKDKNLEEFDQLNLIIFVLALDKTNATAIQNLKNNFKPEGCKFDDIFSYLGTDFKGYTLLFDAWKRIDIDIGSPFKNEDEQKKFFFIFSEWWRLDIIVEAINRSFLSVQFILSMFLDAQAEIMRLKDQKDPNADLQKEIIQKEKGMKLLYSAVAYFIRNHKEIKNDFSDKKTFLSFSTIIKNKDNFRKISGNRAVWRNEKPEDCLIKLGDIFHQQQEFEQALLYYLLAAKENVVEATKKVMSICGDKDKIKFVFKVDLLCATLESIYIFSNSFLYRFYGVRSEIIEEIKDNIYYQISRQLQNYISSLEFRRYYGRFSPYSVPPQERETTLAKVFNLLTLNSAQPYAKLAFISQDILGDDIPNAIKKFCELKFSTVDRSDLIESSIAIIKLCHRYLSMKCDWDSIFKKLHDEKVLAHFVNYFITLLKYGILEKVTGVESSDVKNLIQKYHSKSYFSHACQLTWLYLLRVRHNDKKEFQEAFEFCKKYNKALAQCEKIVETGTDVIEIKKDLVKNAFIKKEQVTIAPEVGRAHTGEVVLFEDNNSGLFKL